MLEIVIDYWKPIILDGEISKYAISTDGIVRNMDTGRILRQRIDKRGYKRLSLSHHNKQYGRLVHRLVAEAFIPNPNNLPFIDHLDCDKTNNSITNLEWVTNEENMRRATENDLRPSKLTKSDVIKICTLLELRKYTDQEIADMLDNKVSAGMIGCIRTGKSWKRIRKKFKIDWKHCISEEKAEEVCKYLAQGFSNKETAEKFGMTAPAVGRIRQGKSWKHISKKYKIPFKPKGPRKNKKHKRK